MPRPDTSSALTETADDPAPAALHATPWQIQRVLCGRVGVLDLRDEPPRVLCEGRPLFLGREVDEARDLRLFGPLASRQHAEIELRGEVPVLRDLGSKNGTFVNGAPVDCANLASGDVLRIGGSLLVVGAAPLGGEDIEIAGLIGDSPAARELRRGVARLAREPSDLLVLGESGSGKELVARAVATHSRRPGEVIVINCSTITESLADKLLFGSLAGVATDTKSSAGYARDAHRGVLFLDEVGDLLLALQPKLLRLLENREVVPLGASHATRVDVRIIAATHKDLVADVRAGRFRQDLYARLAQRRLHVPPLRQRREDILALLSHFLPQPRRLSGELAEQLLLHPWPLNVRGLRALAAELAAAPQRDGELPLSAAAAWLAEDALLATPEDTPPAIPVGTVPGSATSRRRLEAPAPSSADLRDLVDRFDGKILRIAESLGLSRRHTLRLIRKDRALIAELERRRGRTTPEAT